MDISKLMTQGAHEEGVEVEIFHPSERVKVGDKLERKSLGVFFTVLGVDSVAFQAAEKKAYNKQLALYTKDGEITEEAQIEGEIILACASIIGWRGIQEGNGDVPFSQARCLELVTKSPWIRKQIDEFVGERKNFIKG